MIREVYAIARYTAVRMTPAGRHLGQMLPSTPALSSFVKKPFAFWKAEQEQCTSLETIPESEVPTQRRLRMCRTMPAMVAPELEVEEEVSPQAKARRRARRTQSLKGWTPPALATPASSKGNAQDADFCLGDDSQAETAVVDDDDGRSTMKTIDSVASMADSVNSEKHVPSLLELGRIYSNLTWIESDGSMGVAALEEAIEELNDRFRVGLQKNDAPQLLAYLKGIAEVEDVGTINRQGFTVGLRDLLLAIDTAGKQLSLAQLRLVMMSAFERFDMNNDGEICPDEFAAALDSIGFSLTQREILVLHRFLAAPVAASTTIQRDALTAPAEESLSLEDQCRKAIEGAMAKVSESTGLSGASKLVDRIARAMQTPGDAMQRAKRGYAVLCGKSSSQEGLLADATELAVSVSGTALVLMHVHLNGPDAASLTSMAELADQAGDVAESLVNAIGDLFQSGGPLAPVLLSGLLGAAKALPKQELVALEENEALLFARNFHDKNCSQGLFQKLLATAGCSWKTAEAGDSLQDSSELKIIVRGEATAGDVDLLPGTVIGSSPEATAKMRTTYVAWDLQELNKAAKQDRRLTDLVKKLKEDSSQWNEQPNVQRTGSWMTAFGSPTALRVGHIGSTSPSASGWFSPVGAAIRTQAQRKGLPRCSQLSEGLQRVLAKPEASLKEKLDQCGALVWDGIDEITESVEAAADLAGACSVLAALGQNAGATSADDLLQLAPLWILLALTGAQAARKAGSSSP